MDIPQDASALIPQELAAIFKTKFVRDLKNLKRHGKLNVSHSPEDEGFDDWLTPIADKNWIADAQITPDCLATKEQCSVYLSGIFPLSPEGDTLGTGKGSFDGRDTPNRASKAMHRTFVSPSRA